MTFILVLEFSHIDICFYTKMGSIDELKQRIEELEAQLAATKQKDVLRREKIENMSSEVVDSNPYRYSINILSDNLW